MLAPRYHGAYGGPGTSARMMVAWWRLAAYKVYINSCGAWQRLCGQHLRWLYILVWESIPWFPRLRPTSPVAIGGNNTSALRWPLALYYWRRLIRLPAPPATTRMAATLRPRYPAITRGARATAQATYPRQGLPVAGAVPPLPAACPCAPSD